MIDMAIHAQSIQNNKFAKSLQYSKVFYLGLKLDQNFAQNDQFPKCSKFTD